MRYIYACFKGYIGFYNGMGLTELEIDFRKCKNNIVLITGKNASGKSTLMNALNIFPDASSSFVPNMDGEKLLTLINDNDIYNIRILYPSDNKGGRKQSKAFISKNGLELNDNGNITSYKEIIFSEFELDSNYISLSKLSGNDRGLGDKKPAERKRFTANIINNLETYNEIYKTLNKKSSIFKSHINTIHTKIQNIGTKENIEVTLNSLQQKAMELESQIMNLNNQIVSIEAKSSIDEDEARKIKELNAKYNSLVENINSLYNELKIYINKTKIKEEYIFSKYEEDSKLLNSYINKLDSIQSEWKIKSERLDSVEKSILSTEADIESIKNDSRIKIGEEYSNSNNKLKELNSELDKLNLINSIDYIPIIELLLESYMEFIEAINKLYEYSDQDLIEFITSDKDQNYIIKLTEYSREIISKIESNKDKLNDLLSKLKLLSVLENRPSKCTIDNCPFISEALSLQNDDKSINLELDKLQEEQLKLSKELSTVNDNIIKYSGFLDIKSKYNPIFNKLIETSLKTNNENLYINIDFIYSGLRNNSQFNNLRDPKLLIDNLNLLKSLSYELDRNSKLKIEYDASIKNIQFINSANKLINNLKEESKTLTKEILELKNSIDSYNSLINNLQSNIALEKTMYDIYSRILDLNKDKEYLELQLSDYKEKSDKALEQISYIEEYKAKIVELNSILNPIKIEINRLSGQLTLLESYYNEYNQYKEKYSMIETIKKYCSPTGGGIQTIFMQLYMNKTLELSNQVLQMLFGGEYKLLDFVINQNEFRIPFIGSGLPVDDISSGSASQICMMGMVINLVLLYQASTKFNIASLDEIDQGLDHNNRMEFLHVLQSIIKILDIEQLFIISHSIEADSSSADVILLKQYDNYGDSSQIGNVIYDYSKEIEKTFN